MAEYISREKAIETIQYRVCQGHGNKELICKRGSCAYCGIMEVMSDIESIEAADVQSVVDTENMAIVSDEFICKKCGIYLKDYTKVVMDEDNDGYIDEQHYEYEPKFCPECGAKVESCIKTPKRDKPLYTMDEICKMNGIEFKGGEQNDKTRNV